MLSNCILFSLWRYFTRGGYILIHKSEHGWWPHLQWSKDLNVIEDYQPLYPNERLRCPPPLFRGYVRRRTRFKRFRDPKPLLEE